MRYIRKSGNEIVKRTSLHQILLLGTLLAYLVLALPLPAVLLDHEIGLLTGDPSHTINDDHAWLDHAAGSGLTSEDAGLDPSDLVGVPTLLSTPSFDATHTQLPSVRGPPSV